MFARRSPDLRSGFTLVELLVVIVILAMLMGLGLYGATVSMKAAKRAAILVELDQLSGAIEGLKGQAGAYPPCMGALTSNSSNFSGTTMLDRARRMDIFVRQMFPRSAVPYSALVNNMGTANYLYKYSPSAGSVSSLSINSMDQAEALVFWLGGFPAPVDASGTPLVSRKLIGFNLDPQNPFRLDPYDPANPDVFVRARSPSRFSFQEERLIDTDNDGWLEYAPNISGSLQGATPPYVYFDSGVYRNWLTTSSACPFFTYPQLQSGGMASIWGVAAPIASAISGGNIQWMNSNGFQILCCGLDLQYGPSTPRELANNGTPRITFFPLGNELGGNPTGYLDTEEEDNLTNFSNQTLGDAMATAGS